MAEANWIIKFRVTDMCSARFSAGMSKWVAANLKTKPDCKSDTNDLCAMRMRLSSCRRERRSARTRPAASRRNKVKTKAPIAFVAKASVTQIASFSGLSMSEVTCRQEPLKLKA